MNKLSIIGAGGLLGAEISEKLFDSYNISKIPGLLLYKKPDVIARNLEGSKFILNLAGHNVAGRWTKGKKELIRNSRLNTTRNLVEALGLLKQKPDLFINASGISIYNDGNISDESTTDYSGNFLAKVVVDWEAEASKAKMYGINTAIIRIGVVLTRKGGAYPKLRSITNFYLGGIIGNGKQGMSVIHIDDLVRSIDFIMQKGLTGIINLSIPEPTTNAELTRTLAKELKRPVLFRIPSLFLYILLSDGHVMITQGQKAYPAVLLKNGFQFQFPNVYKCIRKLEE